MTESTCATTRDQNTCCPTPAATRAGGTKLYRPNVDIVDTPESVLLTADVPGADEQSVEMTIEKDVLTLHARVEPPKFEGYAPASFEYGVGDYERKFTLSHDIDRSAIEASVKDGVLRVRLPKRKGAGSHKIRVNGG